MLNLQTSCPNTYTGHFVQQLTIKEGKLISNYCNSLSWPFVLFQTKKTPVEIQFFLFSNILKKQRVF